MSDTAEVGDVYQITDESEGREGWLGAFVLVTEPKTWGIMGFVHSIDTHESSSQVFIRLGWSKVEFVGSAPLTRAE